MVSKLDQTINFHRQALGLRAYRQQVLAANIANSDTPNYKARDIDFSAALDNALAGKQTGDLGLARTSTRHIAGAGNSGPAPLLYRSSFQPSADGNTVDMDVERTQIAENAMQYQILTQLISDKFKGIRSAMASNNA